MYYCYFFCYIFIIRITSLDYQVPADDYLISIYVNGIKKLVLGLEIAEGNLIANQRDEISFEIQNYAGSGTPMGIWAKLNLMEYSFLIGNSPQPFLRCDKTLSISNQPF